MKIKWDHKKCRGHGCEECCDTGSDPTCSECSGSGNVRCHIVTDGFNVHTWLCLDCFSEYWRDGEVAQGQVLVAPMMASELARLTDKGTAS